MFDCKFKIVKPRGDRYDNILDHNKGNLILPCIFSSLNLPFSLLVASSPSDMAARDSPPPLLTTDIASESSDSADDVIDELDEDLLEDDPAACISCDHVAASVSALFAHLLHAHAIDLHAFIQKQRLLIDYRLIVLNLNYKLF